jgi:hypothetical protein
MAIRSRADLVPPLGLFIFLDLITALSGVLVLITMFLTSFLERGSPLFPGSATRPSPMKGAALRGQLQEREQELRRAEELAEKLKWAEYSPREIRRMLRRLQGLSAEGGEVGEKNAEQILAEVGLVGLKEEVQAAEAAWRKREAEIAAEREAHETLDRRVREAQSGQGEALGKERGIRLVRDGRDTTKRPIVVELAYGQAKLYPLDQTANFARWEPDAKMISRLRRELFGYPPDTHYIFLLVQPSGYRWFAEVRAGLQAVGYEVGFDGISEDPRLALAEGTLRASPGFRRPSVLGDPEPWPVEGRED